jgi:hypothetical protein
MNRAFLVTAALLSLAGCQTDSRQQVLATSRGQVEMRSISTRGFDTPDRQRVLRASLAALQDLGFVIDRADDGLGVISATKLQGYVLKLTITVRPRGQQQVVVRASGQYNQAEIADAETFNNFFRALEQALFLNAQQVD